MRWRRRCIFNELDEVRVHSVCDDTAVLMNRLGRSSLMSREVEKMRVSRDYSCLLIPFFISIISSGGSPQATPAFAAFSRSTRISFLKMPREGIFEKQLRNLS